MYKILVEDLESDNEHRFELVAEKLKHSDAYNIVRRLEAYMHPLARLVIIEDKKGK